MAKGFREIVESGKGGAVIMAGSGSDKEHIKKLENSLEKYGVPYEVRICSAHKQPGKLMDLIESYNNLNAQIAYIAVAGGTDALSGTLSYHAHGPVVSSPPDGRNLSVLSNPPGSSNAYIENPSNVGRFVAQIFSWANPKIKEALELEKAEKNNSLENADVEFLEGEL